MKRMLQLSLPKPLSEIILMRSAQEIRERVKQLEIKRQITRYAPWQAMIDCRIDELEWTLKERDVSPATILITHRCNDPSTEVPCLETVPVRSEQEIRARLKQLESEKQLTHYSPWLALTDCRINELRWILRKQEM